MNTDLIHQSNSEPAGRWLSQWTLASGRCTSSCDSFHLSLLPSVLVAFHFTTTPLGPTAWEEIHPT